jgi:hypothetical protein
MTIFCVILGTPGLNHMGYDSKTERDGASLDRTNF